MYSVDMFQALFQVFNVNISNGKKINNSKKTPHRTQKKEKKRNIVFTKLL